MSDYRKEFPDYPQADMPVLPPQWIDHSWHNDACPSFLMDIGAERYIALFVDYPTEADRAFPELDRFCVFYGDYNGQDYDPRSAFDDLAEALAYADKLAADKREETAQTMAGYFADILHDWSTPEQWAKMKADNAAETCAAICHSHDFCDANMAMEAAFKRQFGREPRFGIDDEAGENEDIAIWNRAWDIAKAGWLTDGCENVVTVKAPQAV